jgi:hypothetical protein
MFESEQKNVMIIFDDGREAEYAHRLFQLISQLPGFELPQPIKESEYKSSFATIDNAPGNVIFFGNGKEAETQGKAVDWRYRKFGMKYGWLGNRCVVTADPDMVALSEQSEFADYYNYRVEQFQSILNLCKINFSRADFLDDEWDAILDEIKWNPEDNATDKIAKGIGALILSPLLLLTGMVKTIVDTGQDSIAYSQRGELWKRQYELLVCEFFLNGFDGFMNSVGEKLDVTEDKIIIVYDDQDAADAHLLYNLIKQYKGYDIGEYTEKMFNENAKDISSKNKIVFLGNIESAKKRSLALKYKYDEFGMRYGWIGNHCFINTEALKSEEYNDFIKYYSSKASGYDNKAKAYKKSKGSRVGKDFAIGVNVLYTPIIFSLPEIIGIKAAQLAVGKLVDKTIDNVRATTVFKTYQYQLLLREFVFNGLSDFMGVE